MLFVIYQENYHWVVRQTCLSLLLILCHNDIGHHKEGVFVLKERKTPLNSTYCQSSSVVTELTTISNSRYFLFQILMMLHRAAPGQIGALRKILL